MVQICLCLLINNVLSYIKFWKWTCPEVNYCRDGSKLQQSSRLFFIRGLGEIDYGKKYICYDLLWWEMWVINICQVPAEQMKQLEGSFINNAGALIWLNRECMLPDTLMISERGSWRRCELNSSFCSVLEQRDKSWTASEVHALRPTLISKLWTLSPDCYRLIQEDQRRITDVWINRNNLNQLKIFCSQSKTLRSVYNPVIVNLWFLINPERYYLIKH